MKTRSPGPDTEEELDRRTAPALVTSSLDSAVLLKPQGWHTPSRASIRPSCLSPPARITAQRLFLSPAVSSAPC